MPDIYSERRKEGDFFSMFLLFNLFQYGLRRHLKSIHTVFLNLKKLVLKFPSLVFCNLARYLLSIRRLSLVMGCTRSPSDIPIDKSRMG